MSELPKGWAAATLNDLLGAGGLFSDGDWVESKDQDPDGQNRLLQLADIGDGFFVDKSSRFVNDEKFSSLNCTEVKAGDVLIARMPDPLGRACLMPAIPQRCLTVVDVAVFRVGDTGVSNKWLMHFLNSSPVRLEIELNSSGTTRKRISRGRLGEILLPVPPLAEQTRIAAKLDELLAQVDTLKARIDAIPTLLKRFRQSVLAAAVSGRLTEEWRGLHPERPTLSIEDLELGIKSSGFKTKAKGIAATQVSAISGWVDAPLGAVFSVKSGDGLTAKEMNEAGNIPVYGGNGVNGHHTECNVTTRTVVIGRVGYYCGSVHFTPSNAWVTDNALIVSYPSALFDIHFVYWLLLGTNLRENTSSSAQPVISGEKIYPLNLSIPPLTEQVEIARRVKQLFAIAEQLEAKVATAQARINHLTQSILAKAFRGELVPQDPNDEPASVLLERIKAQRAAAPKAKRGRKASA
ncbi:restriction endonuclease subunit S [Stutzerimonas nitrititolerans]|uniref:restriction endonuclease subunit S n=1 Tax=Stutzerimonas nitrititolerans TaxID=2482751 RepID=UPI00289B47C3|nr:restriction endonuclease subunit S [Stutzerimonas nitrititolerans]